MSDREHCCDRLFVEKSSVGSQNRRQWILAFRVGEKHERNRGASSCESYCESDDRFDGMTGEEEMEKDYDVEEWEKVSDFSSSDDDVGRKRKSGNGSEIDEAVMEKVNDNDVSVSRELENGSGNDLASSSSSFSRELLPLHQNRNGEVCCPCFSYLDPLLQLSSS